MSDRDLELPLFPEPSRPGAAPPDETPSEESSSRPTAAPAPERGQGSSGPGEERAQELSELFPEAPAAQPSETTADQPAAPTTAPAKLGTRVLAGLLDLSVLVSVVALLVVGCSVLGTPVDSSDWPALLLFALSFSFLYFVVPLAFWGWTAGMAAVGLVARSPGRQPLSFQQSALRWTGAVLTLALFGLPLLWVLTGASFSDRLSGSATFLRT